MSIEDEPITDPGEESYVRGGKAAWRLMLGKCLAELGIDDPEAASLLWVTERLDTVATLRMLCEEYGDNDWPDNSHLADVIEKHLVDHLTEE